MPKIMPGESLVLPPLHRHWIDLARRLALPSLVATALLLAGDVPPSFVVPSDVKIIFTMVVLAAVGGYGYVAWLLWHSYQLTVTDQRVITEEGVFQRSSKVIPLDRVQDVATNQSVAGRFLDYGDVEIYAAGSSEKFPYVSSPEILRDQVFVLSEQLRRGL